MHRTLLHLFAFALAAAMLFMGSMKFGAENHIFEVIAQRSGIALFEPQVRMLTGVLEVVAGLLMILPRSRGAGALLATGIVGGAVLFHLSPWLGISVAMAAGEDASPRLFLVALLFLALALVNLYLNRSRVPFVGDRLSPSVNA